MRGRFLGASRPFTAFAVTLLMFTTALQAVAAPAQATAPAPPGAPAAPAAPRTPCPAEVPDRASALITARLCGGRVEIAEERSETNRVWANPTGDLTAEVQSAPVRLRDGKGGWRAVDLNLAANADGSVSAKAHPRGLKLSGAAGSGAHELVSLGTGDERVAVVWHGRLPRPVLDGTRATYRDVRAGVDLVIESNRTGYEQFFVVKTAAALRGTFALRLRAPKLDVMPDKAGGLLLKKDNGRDAGRIPQPTMWDARVGAKSLDPLRVAKVGLVSAPRGGDVDLTLTPDPTFVAAPDLAFPVTIDPSVYPAFDTFVQSGYVSDQSGSTDLKLGYSNDGGAWTARSFLRWNVPFLAGTTVSAATVNLFNYHSWSCTAAGWEVWDTDAVSTATRWTSQPTWKARYGTSTQTKGANASCNDGWVSAPATGLFQLAAQNNYSLITMGLRAQNEGTNLSWKRFYSSEGPYPPFLTINYNTAPNVTSMATDPPSPCLTGAERPHVGTATPALRAQITDPEGTPVSATFEWASTDGTAAGSATVGPQASGSTIVAPVPTGQLADGESYKWRVRASDGDLSSAFSGYCEFTVDTSPPDTPRVSSPVYPENRWTGQGGYTATKRPGTPYVDGTTTLPLTGDDEEQTIELPFPVSFYGHTYTSAWVSTNGQVAFVDPGSQTYSLDELPDPATPNGTVYVYGDDLVVDEAASIRTAVVGAAPNRRFVVEWKNPHQYGYADRRQNAEVVFEEGTSKILLNYSGLDNADERGTGALVGIENTEGTIATQFSYRTASLADNTAIELAYAGSSTPADAGVPASFTFRPGAFGGAAAYLYGLDQNPPTTTVNPAENGGAVTVSLTPATDGPHTLYVRSQDRAGNQSPIKAYPIKVGRGGLTAPARGDITTGAVTLAVEASPAVTGVRYQWRRAETDAWTAVPAVDVSTASGAAVTWPAPVSGGVSAPLTWAAGRTVPDNPALQVRAVLTSASGEVHTGASRVVIDRDATKSARVDVGPGSVSLVTGDFRMAANDAAAFDMGISRTASSRQTALGTQAGQVPAFGPQWALGYASGTSFNAAWLRRPIGSTVEIVSSSGALLRFGQRTGGGWQPEPGGERSVLAYDADADRFTLTDVVDGGFVVFGKVAAGAGAYAVLTSGTPARNSTFTYVHDTVTTNGTALNRLRRIIAPTSAVASATCAADPAVKGCRVLELIYADSTTATSAALGDVAGRVNQVRVWATAPGAGASTAVTLARYGYDQAGLLREVWDPRVSPALKTAYTYAASGAVATLTPPGLQPWTFTYGTAGPALPNSGPGMLLAVSRPTLQPGSATATNGVARTTVVYDVPTTRGEGGPYALGAEDVATWGQQSPPATAVAIFPPDAVPAGNTGRGALGSAAYTRATVHYLGRNGLGVNVASPGGHLSTTEHDEMGHQVRQLSAANRALALGTAPDAARLLNELGLAQLSTAQRASMLSSATTYRPEAPVPADSLAPAHTVTLARTLPGAGGLPEQPAGSRVVARSHTRHTYDQGRPADARVRFLDTRIATGASVTGYAADGDVTLADTEYNWTLGLPTKVISDPTGIAITETSVYDADGNLIEKRLPASNGNDAAATFTDYWAADGGGACGGRPEWAGLQCRTGPKALVTGAGGNPDELVATTTTYTTLGQVATSSDTAEGSTRVTTTSYDTAERPTGGAVTGGLGDPVPSTVTEYDPATGLATRTVDSAGTQITNSYDTLGRVLTYTDAAGATTSYEYDALDRKTRMTNPAGTTTYAYDTAIEPRGLLTSTTDSIAGTFTATYDANGAQIGEQMPGGVTRSTTIDQVGMPVAVSYTTTAAPAAAARATAAAPQAIVTEELNVDIGGQWMRRTGLSVQTYTNDALGRITRVDDVSEDVCTRRTYGYTGTAGRNSNRATQSRAVGAAGAPCSDAGAVTTTHSYDSADRIVDAGYSYDAFGRTVTTPGLSLAYRTDDRIRQQRTADVRQTWDTDAAGRPTAVKVEALEAGTWSTVQSKLHHFASGSDSPDWIVEDTATGQITRNVAGGNGQLAATTSATGDVRLQLTNLHGDVIAAYSPASGAVELRGADEFGVPTTASTERYGWLGGFQRSKEALGGTMLIGARVYQPTTGRFLQTDPLPGGSANAYDYCSANPTGCVDTTGYGTCSLWGLVCGKVFNNSNRYMRIGEIGGGGGGCRIFDDFLWKYISSLGCYNVKGLPAGKNSRSRNSYLKDADIATFSATGWFTNGLWMSQREYIKVRNYESLKCGGGTWGRKPTCWSHFW